MQGRFGHESVRIWSALAIVRPLLPSPLTESSVGGARPYLRSGSSSARAPGVELDELSIESGRCLMPNYCAAAALSRLTAPERSPRDVSNSPRSSTTA